MNKILTATVDALLAERHTVIVAVDGMAASGKTTLAKELSVMFSGAVIHMDDFFLPACLRTDERMAQPGGNVHYERFNSEVAERIEKGEDFSYGVFDCSVMTITKEERIRLKGLIIIEGAYCMRSEWRHLYDLKVFMKTGRTTQMERILQRNGAEKARMFEEKWIPLENAYFKEFNVESAADIIIGT